jgi:hypothetical protein
MEKCDGRLGDWRMQWPYSNLIRRYLVTENVSRQVILAMAARLRYSTCGTPGGDSSDVEKAMLRPEITARRLAEDQQGERR